VAPWTFVGRAAELDRLSRAAAGTTGRGLIFGGAPGIGKTRLLREGVTGLDQTRFALVNTVASTATAILPLGSLAPALPAEQPGGISPTGLLRWAVDAIQRHAAGRPLVLAIDDAHLLDPLSAALVYFVARGGSATVLGTLRTGAPVPDLVRALWTEDLVDRVELGALSRAETAELLHHVLGAPMDTTSVDRLWSLAQGTALLLRELVRAAVAGGDLTETYGIWHWSGRLELTPTLTDIVDSRIGRLSPEVREVLELVAFGAPIGLPLLVKATDGAAVEVAEERALIRVVRDDRRTVVRLAHPLYGEVLRQRCPLTRVRRLLADLAHLVEATGARRRDDLLRVALWRLDSDTARDPNQLLRACRTAFARYELPLAERLGRAAVAAGGGFDAAEALGGVLMLGDEPDAAVPVLDAAHADLADDRQRTRWLGAHAISRYWGHGEESALESGAAAGSAVEALMRLHHGEPDAARRLATAVLDEPTSAPVPRALARAALAHLLAAAGATRPALAAVAEVADGADRWHAEAPYVRLALELARGTALITAGEPGQVDATADFGDFRLGSGYLALVRAQAARLRGDLVAAGRLAAQACALLAGGRIFTGLAHAERAHAAALTGDAEAAAAAMAEADRTHRGTMTILYPWLEQARAWVAVAAGDVGGGVRVLRELAARTRRDGFAGHEAVALLDLVRLGVPDDAATHLARLAAGDAATPLAATPLAATPLAVTAAGYAGAAARRDGAALLVAVEEFAGRGLNLYAAEAAATAVTLLRQARSPAAPGAAERLSRLLAYCPTARTPALEINHPALTNRERQIARLAAAGVASKEIADQLYLSPRTVDNHLMRVYAKLGVTGRTELAAALRALPGEE
jgi:DNA-binding CsgD family transcriptional regulator